MKTLFSALVFLISINASASGIACSYDDYQTITDALTSPLADRLNRAAKTELNAYLADESSPGCMKYPIAIEAGLPAGLPEDSYMKFKIGDRYMLFVTRTPAPENKIVYIRIAGASVRN